MKGNGGNEKNELEMLLKGKMDELSSNVDCFDKIASKAFPEIDENSTFGEEGDIIRDLENITGRSNSGKFKWLAVAAAVILIVGIVPKTAIINYFLDNTDNRSAKRKYSDILSIVLDEREMSGYEVFDVGLDYYIRNDVLVTPMYGCPFEMTDEDARVRVFVRTFDGTMTNQMYAVEYSGEFRKDNIIAAAETGAEFADGELKAAEFVDNSSKRTETVSKVFTNSEVSSLMYYGDREVNNIGGFSADIYFKEDNGDVLALNNDVLFFSMSEGENAKRFCDVLTEYYDENGAVTEWAQGKCCWETSLYYNGERADPEKDGSDFARTNMYYVHGGVGTQIAYVAPYKYRRNDDGTVDQKSFTSDEFDRFEAADESIRVILRKTYPDINGSTRYELTEYNYNVPADKRTRMTFTSYFSHYDIDAALTSSGETNFDVYVKNGRSLQINYNFVNPTLFFYYPMDYFIEEENWVQEYLPGNMSFDELYAQMQEIMAELIDFGLPSDYPDLYNEETGLLSPETDGEYDEEKSIMYNKIEAQHRSLVGSFLRNYTLIVPVISTEEEREKLDELMELGKLHDGFWSAYDSSMDESEYRAAAKEFMEKYNGTKE